MTRLREEPTLQPWPVVRRGLAFGIAALVVVTAIALALARAGDRSEVLAVTAGWSLIVAACFLPIGAFYTWCCGGDLRRLRDWRTIGRGRYDGIVLLTPVLLRTGAFGLALGAGALLVLAVLEAL